MQRQNVTMRSHSPMGGRQSLHMKSKGYGGPMMGGAMPIGSPLGAPMVGFPSEPMMGTTYMQQAPMMETTYMQAPMMESTYMQAPMMSAGPTMMAPQLPAGYYEPGMAGTTTTTTYPAMGMMPQTMGAVMPNNNKWKVTMRSKGNAPPMGMPAGTVGSYGNEHYDYKLRERSGGLFSHGPKTSVHIKERHHGGGGGYYGGSVMPGYTTVGSPMVGAMPQYYQEEVLQQYPYGAGAYGG